jgi:hypothetical protein
MNRLSTSLRSDLVIVAGLVALGVAARLLPHEPNFTPIAASTLFAATVLRTRRSSPLRSATWFSPAR